MSDDTTTKTLSLTLDFDEFLALQVLSNLGMVSVLVSNQSAVPEAVVSSTLRLAEIAAFERLTSARWNALARRMVAEGRAAFGDEIAGLIGGRVFQATWHDAPPTPKDVQ